MFQALLFPLVVLAIFTLFKSVCIVRQNEKALVLSLGKFSKILNPGLNFLVPFIETAIAIDMRERVINVAPQEVITKDNVSAYLVSLCNIFPLG